MPIASIKPTFLFQAPFAWLRIEHDEQALTHLELLAPGWTPAAAQPAASGLGQQIENALHTYFATQNMPSHIPQKPQGTPFQQKVWHALQHIPTGNTLTYGHIAQHLNTSPRAVGNACRANPIPLFVPCHRVVAAHGIGGFMGKHPQWFAYKHWLLTFEGVDTDALRATQKRSH